MRKCIVFLGDVCVYTLVQDNILVFHNKFSDLANLPALLYNQDIDSITFFCQGTVVPHITKDSRKIGSIFLESKFNPVVLQENDISFFTQLTTILKIKEVNIVSYFDYLQNKYKAERVLVAHKYLSDYAITYVDKGKVKYFVKSTRSQLQFNINRCVEKFNCPVVCIESPSEVDKDKILAATPNAIYVPEDQLFALDYVPYCLTAKGVSLYKEVPTVTELGESEDNPLEAEDEAESEEEIDIDDFEDTDIDEHNLDRPLHTKPRIFSIFKTNDYIVSAEEEEASLKASESLTTVALVIILSIIILSVALSLVFRHKTKNLDAEVALLQHQVEGMNCSLQVSPAKQISTLYTTAHPIKEKNSLILTEYKSGALSLIILSNNESERSEYENLIETKYTIDDKIVIGRTTTTDNTQQNKTKYQLTPRPT